MRKRYGDVTVEQVESGKAWVGVASIDGGKDDAKKWIVENGVLGETYRIARIYPERITVKATERRFLASTAEPSE